MDNWGRIGNHALSGYFFREARYLSSLTLEIDGEEPAPCSVAEVRPNSLEFTYIYPQVKLGAGGGSGSGGQEEWHEILRRGLDARLRYLVHPASIDARLWITNRWNERVDIRIGWKVAADYVDLPEAQSGECERHEQVETVWKPDGVIFRYLHPKLPFETRVSAKGPGKWSFGGQLLNTCTLIRQQTVELQLRIEACDKSDPIDAQEEAEREEYLKRWVRGVAIFEAPAETPLVDITNCAMQDVGSLALLDGPKEEWLTPAAGAPLYLAVWGRDALTAPWQMAIFDDSQMAESALLTLGRMQGIGIDPEHDEEPGRIIQQSRKGPRDRLDQTPFARYYADYASPFAYIFTLGYTYSCTAEPKLLERHWGTAKRIMAWAREYGDHDKDGYLEYKTQSPHGPKHQGWKDSDNAIVYEDGRQVEPPLATCEIQGYYYAAMQVMATLSVVMGEEREALRYWREAKDLKERFNRDFWMEDRGFVAMGLDRDKRLIRTSASDPGQCMATGIVSDDRIPRLAARLFEPDLFSGWGIRTLSAANPAYNPLDYHLGSVWLVENATIIFGLRRFGLNEESIRLSRALYDLALMWPGYRVPECVGGYSREEFCHPGAYPRANSPQLWNQSAWPLLMHSILGLQPLAPMRILFVDPILPAWLPEVIVRKIRIGDAVTDLRFWRDSKGDSHFEVVDLEGRLKIVRQPPANSLSAGIWDRLLMLVESLVKG